MLSIAEYVKQRGVSQTAVRRQLQRYQEELEGHTPKVNRRTMLDDYAVEFLDAHRMPREVIIEQASDEVQKEIADLKGRLDLMKEQVIRLQEQIIALQGERTDLLVEQARNRLLIEGKDKETSELQARLTEADKENKELQTRLDESEREANSYIKSWFGLYKKVNG